MGDRFYQQQNEYFNKPRGQKKMSEKPKRKLKKDVVKELEAILGEPIPNIERSTIATLESLINSINKLLES